MTNPQKWFPTKASVEKCPPKRLPMRDVWHFCIKQPKQRVSCLVHLLDVDALLVHVILEDELLQVEEGALVAHMLPHLQGNGHHTELQMNTFVQTLDNQQNMMFGVLV